jgi:hypothetical protein
MPALNPSPTSRSLAAAEVQGERTFHVRQQWLPNATPSVRWYLETVCIPGAPLFARLVPIAAK